MAPPFELNRLLDGLPQEAQVWLTDALSRARVGDARALAIAIGRAGRYCGRTEIMPGWTVDQVVRIRLMAEVPADGQRRICFDQIFATAALDELVALYRGLSWYPFAEDLVLRAEEGIRHSATAVFSAVALDNHFPADHLADEAYAQMVLKAFFQNVDIDRIVGVGRRMTDHLRAMLCDYARERRAAGRSVDPRLLTLTEADPPCV